MIGGRYELRERLGAGAMSEVWLAEDRKLERSVALKLLAPHADSRRFEREARAAAALSHPNVARIYEYGVAAGRAYMALELLSGGTLEGRLQGGRPLPDTETERVARQLAAGLAHAHAHGLVHRDLKPANVLFDEEGRAKIADFGIARLEGVDTLTEAGTVMGTAAYISPEQAAGEPASPASDVYSFGVILFRLLTGRLPFESHAPLEVAAMHRTAEPPAISSLRPDAPRELAALAAAAMAKDPRQRPADGAALAGALDGTTQTDALAVPPPPEAIAPTIVIPPSQPRRSRRRLWIAVAGVAAALLAAAGIAAAVLLSDDTGAGTTTPATTRHRPATTGVTAPTTTASPPPTTTTAPPPTTTKPATTEAPTTTTRPTTTEAPTTTAPPPPTTTTAPPPTTETAGTTLTLPVPP
jgi:eukaryotic-like serine/threonine-protein kinase